MEKEKKEDKLHTSGAPCGTRLRLLSSPGAFGVPKERGCKGVLHCAFAWASASVWLDGLSWFRAMCRWLRGTGETRKHPTIFLFFFFFRPVLKRQLLKVWHRSCCRVLCCPRLILRVQRCPLVRPRTRKGYAPNLPSWSTFLQKEQIKWIGSSSQCKRPENLALKMKSSLTFLLNFKMKGRYSCWSIWHVLRDFSISLCK